MYIFTYAYDDKDANELYSGEYSSYYSCDSHIMQSTTWVGELLEFARKTPSTVPGIWTCQNSMSGGKCEKDNEYTGAALGQAQIKLGSGLTSILSC